MIHKWYTICYEYLLLYIRVNMVYNKREYFSSVQDFLVSYVLLLFGFVFIKYD